MKRTLKITNSYGDRYYSYPLTRIPRHPLCKCQLPCQDTFECTSPHHQGSKSVPVCFGCDDHVERDWGGALCDGCWMKHTEKISRVTWIYRPRYVELRRKTIAAVWTDPKIKNKYAASRMLDHIYEQGSCTSEWFEKRYKPYTHRAVVASLNELVGALYVTCTKAIVFKDIEWQELKI